MNTLQTRAASIFAGLTFRLVLLGIIALLLVNTYVSVHVPIPLLPDIRFEGWKPKAQRHKTEGEAAIKALATSNASLEQLQGRLAAFIAEGDERKRAAAQALREQQERSAALTGQIERIRVSRPTAEQIERCETPGAVIAAEGL